MLSRILSRYRPRDMHVWPRRPAQVENDIGQHLGLTTRFIKEAFSLWVSDQRETDLSSVSSEIHEERQMAITENYTKEDLIGGRWALHRELAVRRTSLSLIGLLVFLFISADCARGCTKKCTSEPYHDAPQSPESLRLTGRHLKSRQDLVVRIRY